MLLTIPRVLNTDQVNVVRSRLAATPGDWVDGRVTTGHQGAPVKRNLQIAENSSVARDLGDLILASLERNALFISAALPDKVYPPMFNRYDEGMQFGSHVDGAIRLIPGTGLKIRTDISATLFLSEPADYEGGELLIEDTFGSHSVKLAAGDMVLYPSSSLHRVAPVSRGERLASFFWIQSMVKETAQRSLLFGLDTAIQRLNSSNADSNARNELTNCYHNLLRMWGAT